MEDAMNQHNHEEIMKRFNRNALGRLVNNSEKVQGLPITEESVMDQLDMDEQITYLTGRLEDIGGSMYRAAEFEFDEGPCWPGFTKGQTWNGWACPFFTKEVAMNVLDWMAEGNTEGEGTIYEETENTLTIIDLQYPEEPYTIEENKDGFYNLGGSWTWNEKSYYCSLCGQTYEKEDAVDGEFCSQSCKEEAQFNMEDQHQHNHENNVITVFGFEKLTKECLKNAFDWMAANGTCCLAYGDWTQTGYELILTEEQQAYHKSAEAGLDYEWGKLDEEIIEAMIMLPILRNLCCSSLYWNDVTREISTKPFAAAKFGLDFGEAAQRQYEL
jgi:hypothetical protein